MIFISHYLCFVIFGQMSVIALSESHPEVTSVKHTINETETITRLSVDIVINNATTRFDLQSVEGYFAGENTKVYMLNKSEYYELENIMKEVNISFYQDKNTLSSISHVINKRGVSEFNGVIDSDKIISPLTKSIRKRYIIPPHLFSQANNDYENYHIIQQSNVRVKRFSSEERQDSKYGIAKMVFPEILVFVDKSLLQHFENNIVKTVAHTLTMLNGVDLHFRIIKGTEIRLNIAGIVLCQDNIIKEEEFTVNGDTLWRFGNFMYNNTKFKLRSDYDIAVLIGTNSYAIGGKLGQAQISGACSRDPKTAAVLSAALVFEDSFSGIRTTAHELSHLFGVQHDGRTYENVFIKENCPFDDGYIMSYRLHNKNKFLFSKCSQKVMNDFFSLTAADCLRNNPAENRRDKQILRILPGKYMSIDEQCQNLGYLGAFQIDKNVCIEIKCIKKGSGRMRVSNFIPKVAALEGAPCGSNKYCFKGECVKVEVDHEDTIDIDLFLPPYSRLNTTKRAVDEAKKNSDLNSQSSNLMNLIAIVAAKYLYDSFWGF